MEIKLFVLAVLIANVKCYLMVQEQVAVEGVILGDGTGYFHNPLDIHLPFQKYDTDSGVRRLPQSILSVDVKEGNTKLSAKLPVVLSDDNAVSVIGSQSAYSRNIGLMLSRMNGNALFLVQTIIPVFGKQLTGAARVTLLNTDNHSISTNAILTRSIPQNPSEYNYYTYGGKVDYNFKNKFRGFLGAAWTEYLQRTDLTALGHFRIYQNKNVSLYFNVGVTVTSSPFIEKTFWVPTYGFSVSLI